MPDSRPLSSLRTAFFDDPPASSDTSSPYPDRHSRLRRALRNTNDLARDASRDSRAAFSPAIDSPRNTSMSFLRRTRRRLRESSWPEDGTAEEQTDEAPERRPKRRKLNADSPPAVKAPIKYGYYGQVESGRLRMEIVSNDGGEHKDPRNPGISLGESNILKLDKSVYCSERASASILLRHADKTPFCLEKLHIVGPEHGFTAPVRGGLAYVAMDMMDLQKYQDPPYHARRAGIHEPPYIYGRHRDVQASPERLSFSDALRDPEIAAAANRSLSPFPPDWEPPVDDEPYYGADYLRQTDPETHCDIPSPPPDPMQNPPENGMPFTLLSDEEPGPEETSPQEVLDYRLQRMRRMSRRNDPHHWLNDIAMESSVFDESRGGRESAWPLPGSASRTEALLARARDFDSPTPDDTRPEPPTRSGHSKRTSRIPPPPGIDDPNVTAARFYIKRGKPRVAIKFDPPVSGRYILLKLWAGRSNVDVQSVVAKGYAGPRFFPAVQLL